MKISPKSGLPVVRACLFDMDGLLIDSEDLYTICTNKVLREYGKPDIPWNIKAQLQGRPGPEAGKIFQTWANLPISSEEFTTKTKLLQQEYFPLTKPLLGAEQLLQTLSKTSVRVALATSSHAANFKLKTKHLEKVFAVFDEEHRVLGDDPRIGVGRGKPAPDIYLLALKTINDRLRGQGEKEIYPEECLVFEDSVPGVEAGRRAGMQVVWCPHEGLKKEFSGREKEVLAGMLGQHKESDGDGSVKLVKDDVQGTEERPLRRVEGRPGEIDDGWAIFIKSLEEFPYDWYGIETETSLL